MALTVARFEPPLDDALAEAVAEFDCVALYDADKVADAGETYVNTFLRDRGFVGGARDGLSTTYMAIDPDEDPQLLGYVTLALTQVRLTASEGKAADVEAGQRLNFGALRIAMIGVDQRHRGRGIGRLLMDSVIQHAASLSRDVPVRFVVADAANTQLEWYKRQRFVASKSAEEIKRLAKLEERGLYGTSMYLDLGPDPRVLLEG